MVNLSQESDTDDENERLIDMALEDGRNALKQVPQISLYTFISPLQQSFLLSSGFLLHHLYFLFFLNYGAILYILFLPFLFIQKLYSHDIVAFGIAVLKFWNSD